MKRSFIAFSLILLVSFRAFAQDVQYSQYYANPMYLNPASTGSADAYRFGVNFRNQWPALEQTFIAYTGYFDFYEPQIKSSFGVIIQGMNESSTQISIHEIGILYAYRLEFSTDHFLQFGVQGSFVSRDAGFDKVVLGTQLDIDRGVIIGSPGDGFLGESRLRSSDAHAGLMYFGKKVWLGTSVFHLLQPRMSYLADSNEKLPMRIGLHGGYRFDLAPGEINEYFNNTDQERSIGLGFNYKSQGQYTQLDLGAEFFFEPLVLGIWYRGLPTKYELPNNESLVSLIGISLVSGIEIGYSFDYPISKLNIRNSGGAHEISIRYLFLPPKNNKKSFAPLPSFRY